MSTSDAPDWSAAVTVTGSLPSSGPAVSTVPTTVSSVVSIIDSAGTQLTAGTTNGALSPLGSDNFPLPAIASGHIYALDWFSITLPATTTAGALHAYVSFGSLHLVDVYSNTTEPVTVSASLTGLPAPQGSSIAIAVQNTSSNTITGGINLALVARDVTP